MHVGEIAWPEEVIPATLVFRNEHFECTACTDNGVSTNNVIGRGGGVSAVWRTVTSPHSFTVYQAVQIR